VVHPHAVYYLYMILTVMEIEIASGGHRRRDHITPPPNFGECGGEGGARFYDFVGMNNVFDSKNRCRNFDVYYTDDLCTSTIASKYK